MSRRKMTGKPTAAETVAAEQKGQERPTVPVRVQIGFMGPDGKALGAVQYDVAIPIPQAEGEMGNIVVALDAKEIISNLALALQQRAQAQSGGILVPSRELFAPQPHAGHLKVKD